MCVYIYTYTYLFFYHLHVLKYPSTQSCVKIKIKVDIGPFESLLLKYICCQLFKQNQPQMFKLFF